MFQMVYNPANPMSIQLSLPLKTIDPDLVQGTYLEKMIALINGDLDFHDRSSNYASHNFHSFPAKFPPQLPALFIKNLTAPSDWVLDPMSGSGTTILEAALAQRRPVGLDIDPLALLIDKVKTSTLDPEKLHIASKKIICDTVASLEDVASLQDDFQKRFDEETKHFMDYWFSPAVRIELFAILTQIERIEDPSLQAFFKLAFSSTIITKSGGVSLALDLAHTRPHKAKLVTDKHGQILFKIDQQPASEIKRHFTKTQRAPLEEFEKKVAANIASLKKNFAILQDPILSFGDAQIMPLADQTIDLIVTSPPYAANAIDYMRAHKFSLIWLGYPLHILSQKRGQYIGGESIDGLRAEPLPEYTSHVLEEISQLDAKKGMVVSRYYYEIRRVLKEMHRVLKPGKAAIVVVGNSIIRGRDTETQNCLADIGKMIGFEVPAIGFRNLDRDRRMMPVGRKTNLDSQIQNRMHGEYVIGFYKP